MQVCFRFFLVFFLVTKAVIAQEPVKKDSVTKLNEVVVLEGLLVKHAAGITPSEIIGEKVFQNFSPIAITSAINQISGVYILSGALNTNRITIRGVGARTLFGTDKLRLYYNDIPITNGSGFSSIEAFDLENLSQIEVVKGPKATTYGTNLGGAIILNSKEALGQSTNFTNSTTVGSYNLFKNSLSFSHTDDKISLALNYGHIKTNGYRENNSFERDGLFLNTTYKLNSKNKLNFLFNHTANLAQIPSSLGITDFTENPQKAAFTWKAAKGYEANKYTLAGLSYTHLFSKKIQHTTSVFYTYLDHYEARPFGILDEFTNGFGFRSKFYGSLDILDKKANYTLGAELYKDEYNWSEFTNLYQENNGNGSLQGNQFAKNKEFRTQLNTFGSLTMAITQDLDAQLGININKTHYNFRDLFNPASTNKSANREFKPIVLPSFSLNYNLGEAQQLYANVSRGFSNPTLEETLTPDGVINPDIAQEIGTNYELGSTLYFDDKKLNISAAIYQMNIKNLLVAERTGNDQFVGKNAGSTKHQGLELSANYTISISSNFKIAPFANYTLNHHKFINFVDGDTNYSGNELTGVPKHVLYSGLQTQIFTNFSWIATHQYLGAIPLTDANSLYSDAFHVFGTKISYQKKLNSKFALSASFGLNNVFNLQYAQSVLINTQAFGSAEPRYYYPGNARNYYGSFRLKYTL